MTWLNSPPHWQAPLKNTLTLCERLACAPGGRLAQVSAYAFSQAGKQMRSKLLFAVADALGLQIDSLVGAAAAVELVHNASLIHDDLQDGDVVRRGEPAVWAKFGPAQAISVGDMLFVLPARALEEIPLSQSHRWRMLLSLMKSVEEMARGQSEEEALLNHWKASPVSAWDGYKKCCEQKTGALFYASAHLAALACDSLNTELADRAAQPFKSLGVAFQMQDDLVDLWGKKGRERAGNDLREGKPSALVAAHINEHPEDIEWLWRILESDREDTLDVDVELAIQRFEDRGTQTRVMQHLHAIVNQSRQAHVFQELPALKSVFDEMADAMLAPVEHLFYDPDFKMERTR